MEEIVPDKIIFSKRKTLTLQVTREAELVIRAPKYMPKFLVERAVWKNRDWIVRKKSEVLKRNILKPARRFLDGELVSFLGENYIMQREGRRKTPLLENGECFLVATVKNPRKVFENWYKKQAKEIITARVTELARQYGFTFNRVQISSAKTRFGSCSSRKNLSFPWRLIMLPMGIVDYVILHELSHLRHMNHSQKFWSQVEALCPDYKERRGWLKKYGGEKSTL